MSRMGIMRTPVAAIVIALGYSASADAAFKVQTFGGSNNPASIQDTVDDFRADLGNPNNGNAPGPLAGGRREINWDGGGATTSSPGPTPFTVFFNTRGAGITTPGTSFLQTPVDSAMNAPELFALNPTYVGAGSPFTPFSPVRIFTPVGSNITDVTFIVPGSAPTNVFGTGTPATVSGFGAVFTDVDLLGSTRLDFFDVSNNLLFSGNVEPGTIPSGSLSFLGATALDGERIARVRITAGTTALGPNDNPGGGVDIVVMDDFLYSEPQAIVIPEPASMALLVIGGVGLIAMNRRKGRRATPDQA